jgi:hypothetical protein
MEETVRQRPASPVRGGMFTRGNPNYGESLLTPWLRCIMVLLPIRSAEAMLGFFERLNQVPLIKPQTRRDKHMAGSQADGSRAVGSKPKSKSQKAAGVTRGGSQADGSRSAKASYKASAKKSAGVTRAGSAADGSRSAAAYSKTGTEGTRGGSQKDGSRKAGPSGAKKSKPVMRSAR